MWHTGDMGWGWFIVGSLMMLAFWGAVIWLVYALFAGSRRQGGGEIERRPLPREIAEHRFANGEIDEAEFDRIVNKLSPCSS